jgi:hypothetical protein
MLLSFFPPPPPHSTALHFFSSLFLSFLFVFVPLRRTFFTHCAGLMLENAPYQMQALNSTIYNANIPVYFSVPLYLWRETKNLLFPLINTFDLFFVTLLRHILRSVIHTSVLRVSQFRENSGVFRAFQAIFLSNNPIERTKS